jgi:energy-coupling factor transporter ATP-binding protein EcfA2
MRISKIFVPEVITAEKKLKEINLTKKHFGPVVALVGKNGAGKTRILKFVEEYITYITPEDLLEEYIKLPTKIFEDANIGPRFKSAQKEYKLSKAPSTTDFESHKYIYTQGVQGLMPMIRPIVQKYIKIIDNDDLKQIKTTLTSKNLTFQQIIEHNSLLDQEQNFNEISTFNSAQTVQYFNSLSTDIVTNQFNLYLKHKENHTAIQEEIAKKTSYKLFENFQRYVKEFLGQEFSYISSINPNNKVASTLHLNDRPFDINLLSPGQKTLFAYAILFFFLDTSTKTNIKDSIIIIDEPEKHLHPEAQVKLVSAVKNIISDSGQLWIATHSVNILSQLDYNEIIMVKNDEIIPPSRTTPGNSFIEIMGLDDHVAKLSYFINSISEWSYGNFMAQCFKDPDVVFSNNKNDPQFKLFKNFVLSNQGITLLDYGAGKGRIGYTLQEDQELNNKIKYFAYEIDKENYENLKEIPQIGGCYNMTEQIPNENFDFILLCNVLHEISPLEWEKNINIIKSKLKSEGFLLIVEDKFLPKGENANEIGYLILGHSQLNTLMNCKDSLELNLSAVDYEDRIVFTAFKKEQLNPTKKSIVSAIKELETESFQNIKKIRNQVKDLDQGRKYANQTQIYINSKLALELLDSNSKY